MQAQSDVMCFLMIIKAVREVANRGTKLTCNESLEESLLMSGLGCESFKPLSAKCLWSMRVARHDMRQKLAVLGFGRSRFQKQRGRGT